MAKPCYSVEGTKTKKNSKIECVVGSVVASIKKVYEVTASGVTSLLWGGGIEPLFKGIVYLYGKYLRLATRSGATAGFNHNITDGASVFTVSEDGKYVLHSFDYAYNTYRIVPLKYNESTKRYEKYGVSYFDANKTEVVASYWSVNIDSRIAFKVSNDGMYFVVGAAARKYENSKHYVSWHLIVYKNTGTQFEYYKTVQLTDFFQTYNTGMIGTPYGAFSDDLSTLALSYYYTNASSTVKWYSKIYKRTSDDFEFTEIYTQNNDYVKETKTAENVFISRDGKYACLGNMVSGSSGYARQQIVYIDGTSVTQILAKTHSYLYYYGNMVMSADGKNLYFFLDASSSSYTNAIHSYAINGATITYLGELMFDKPSDPSYYPTAGYVDELVGGSHAIIDSYGGVYFSSVSKGTDGRISSFGNITYFGDNGKQAVFIGREF